MNQNDAGVTMAIGNSPTNYDMAFAPVNIQGALGRLNLQVLSAYGYSKTKELNRKNLSKGYHLLEHKGLKPILFVVTVGQKNTKNNLTNNFISALENNVEVLEGKRIWVPLMGTGEGKLTYKESYEIIVNILRKFSFNTNFVISLPENKEGVEFYNSLREQNEKDLLGSTIEAKSPAQKGIYKHEPKLDLKSKTNKKALDDLLKKDTPIAAKHNLEPFIKRWFFLAGHFWRKDDQMPRFINDSVWENGHTDNDVTAVNSIREGDVVFLKSTYAQNGISYLRLKAVGIVKENTKDGHNLRVNWHKFDGHINIENLGKYRRTFARVMPDDVTTVLNNILDDSPELNSILEQLEAIEIKPILKEKEDSVDKSITEKVVNITRIAGLVSDADSGEDYLEIAQDVNAFARVISAKSFIPPLAIALLGKWGSGKSFFMRKLKEQIQEYSNDDEQTAYCTGIAHVHFNAWSYVDSNLWAGIITKIFEGLQEYISNQSKADAEKKEIEKMLLEKLSSSKQHFQELEQRKVDINSKIESLKDKKSESEELLEAKIKDIKNKSIKKLFNKIDNEFKVEDKVKAALVANNSFNQSTREFSNIIPKKYWKSPQELYDKSKTGITFLKIFFGKSVWKNNLFWFSIILIIVLGVPIVTLFTELKIERFDFEINPQYWVALSLIGTILLRGYKTARHLQPLIASFWKLKEDYKLEKENALFKFKQEEKAIAFQIENYKQTIKDFSVKIGEAEVQKKDIEYRLENTRTTEALFNFIENRSTSDDYKKHLGIVSVIRKDFEILSDLFTDHNTEVGEVKVKETYEAFRSKFQRPLERIILYIDDLDRCTDDRVIQVLEAVNLLMAYPLFVVVVGVDPRWVKNALIKKHELQFGGNLAASNAIDRVEPSGYLEKIFQIPFHLQEATDDSVKFMLKTLAESHPDIEESENTDSTTVDYSKIEGDGKGGEIVKSEDDIKLPQGKEGRIVPLPKAIETKEEVIASLKFTIKEVELIQELSKVLGANPRTLKRFVNIFRIIKAHKGFNYSENTRDEELLAIIFLIALPIGKYKCLAKPFESFVNIEVNSNTLKDFLEDTLGSNEEREAKNKIQNIFNNNNTKKLLGIDKIVFKKYNTFIKRFTFNGV